MLLIGANAPYKIGAQTPQEPMLLIASLSVELILFRSFKIGFSFGTIWVQAICQDCSFRDSFLLLAIAYCLEKDQSV